MPTVIATSMPKKTPVPMPWRLADPGPLAVRRDPDDPKSPRIPAVNEERCIGCGACENLCPARPFSAIYVEGHSRHRTV